MSSDLVHAGLKLREQLYKLIAAVGDIGISPEAYDGCVEAITNGLGGGEWPVPNNHSFWLEEKATACRPRKSLGPYKEAALNKTITDIINAAKAQIKPGTLDEDQVEQVYAKLHLDLVAEMQKVPILKDLIDGIINGSGLNLIKAAEESQSALEKALDEDEDQDD